jgi:hypothetical protein
MRALPAGRLPGAATMTSISTVEIKAFMPVKDFELSKRFTVTVHSLRHQARRALATRFC